MIINDTKVSAHIPQWIHNYVVVAYLSTNMDAAFSSSLDMKLPPIPATSTVRSFEDAVARISEEFSLDTEVGTISKEEDSFL